MSYQFNTNEKTTANDKKNILLFLSGKFISLLGTNIYAFAIGLYVLKLTGSAMNFSINFILNMVPRILLGPVAGVISDKFDKKKLVVYSDILSGILLILLYSISINKGLSLTYIYITTALLTSLNTIFSISFDASIPNLVKDENLVKINSYRTSITSITNILGPILGGLIFGIFNINLFILLNGISFILSAISEYFIDFNAYKVDNKKEEKDSSIEKNSIIDDLKEGFNYIKQKKILFTLIMFTPIINFLFIALSICLPFILVNDLLLSSKLVGIVEGAFAIGMLIMSLVFSIIPEVKRKGLVIGIGTILIGIATFLIGVPISGLMTVNSLLFYAIYYCSVAIIIGAIIVFINLPIDLTVQRETPAEYRGRVYGTLGTISSIITPLACIVYGFLLDTVPSHLIVFISGALLAIIGLIISANKTLHKI
ncbi:MFS transporter [Abyssisolibacter fermentans]|uniref:MFS transporter n=1 Tax=Abyssisolibacter fermentans TaxID=1766203 RepID=UPI00082EDB75|nr:MFS transporter [Abyssisolibacter fermentans]